jgi:hypothetical protein
MPARVYPGRRPGPEAESVHMDVTPRLHRPPLIREGSPSGPPEAAPEPQPQHPIDGVVRCGCCGRYPLVGERVTRHIGRRGEEWACANCESEGRAGRLGEARDEDRVRSLGGAANVHRAL